MESVGSPISGVKYCPIIRHEDQRGWLVELFRLDDLTAAVQPQMGYVSETLPGVSRGPHAHHDQTDSFVFLGPGDFKLYLAPQLVNIMSPRREIA